MRSTGNRVIIACAGSGKTTLLVKQALSNTDRRIAIVTYTNNNTREIIKRFGELNSGVPRHVDVLTWFTFLLRQCARPYQRSKYTERRIESIAWPDGRSPWGIPESNTRHYYFANGERIYHDKIAQFIIECEEASGNRVTARLQQIYTDVFIDEFQDLAGWDLDFVEMLLRSQIQLTIVGDPRQHIYSTNPSPKNKQYLGVNVVKLVKKWQNTQLCQVEARPDTRRCSQGICSFANGLWRDLDPMKAMRTDTTGHDGVFLVASGVVEDYITRFAPQVLRYDKKAKSYSRPALNFGMAKGLQFDRVLIVPTEPMKRYLRTGDLGCVNKSRDKLHVAVTRAWHSVAFVYDGPSPIVSTRWETA